MYTNRRYKPIPRVPVIPLIKTRVELVPDWNACSFPIKL